jgi:hypothetical protein
MEGALINMVNGSFRGNELSQGARMALVKFNEGKKKEFDGRNVYLYE